MSSSNISAEPSGQPSPANEPSPQELATYDRKTVRIIMQDRSGRKLYEKMLGQGWEVERIVPHGILRGELYVFRRPSKRTLKLRAGK